MCSRSSLALLWWLPAVAAIARNEKLGLGERQRGACGEAVWCVMLLTCSLKATADFVTQMVPLVGGRLRCELLKHRLTYQRHRAQYVRLRLSSYTVALVYLELREDRNVIGTRAATGACTCLSMPARRAGTGKRCLFVGQQVAERTTSTVRFWILAGQELKYMVVSVRIKQSPVT